MNQFTKFFSIFVFGFIVIPFGKADTACPTGATGVLPACLGDADALKRLDLPSCATLLDPTSPKGLPILLSQYYTDLIQCEYKGFIKTDTTPCTQGSAIKNPDGSKGIVCSFTDGEGTAAQPNNNVGESCNTPTSLQGIWEMTQVRGIWVQAIKFYRKEVLDEITLSKWLKIHPTCQAIADDYNCLNQQAKDGVQTAGLNGSAKDLTSACTAQSGTQSVACFAAASQQSRILLFVNLAKCEIASRANDFYTTFMSTQTQQINQIVSNCTDSASKGTSSNAEGVKKFKACYEPKIRQFFQDAVSLKIPGQFHTRASSLKKIERFA